MIDPDDIEVEINALSFSIIMSDINNTEVEIPKKVTKDAIEYDAFSGMNFFEDEYLDEVDSEEDSEEDSDEDIDSNGKDDMEVQEWHPGGISDDPVEYIEGYYDESTGKFMLCDYYDTPLYTFVIPDEYSMSYYDDTGRYYCLYLDDSYEGRMYISDSILGFESDYIVGGEVPDEIIATDFVCEYTEFEIDGVELVKTYTSYVPSLSDEDFFEGYGVGIKYINYWGEEAYIGIDITKEMYDDWDNTLEVICEMIQVEN